MRRLFGYYRQFSELSPDEVSRSLREQRARLPVAEAPLDLSGAAWPGPPHPEVINAATFALRRAVNAYPDDGPLRAAIAGSLGVDAERVVIGHGAGELLRAALAAVAGAEVEVVWPGWGALPSLVRSVGATPVPVPAVTGTRTAVVCRPNDPTGAVPSVSPGAEWLVLDEALADFVDGGAPPVLEGERVIHVRSFSKGHAMAGFRVGYAIVPPGGPDLRPVMGVGAPALAGALWAVEHGGLSLARRREQAARSRARLAAEFPVADGVGPYAWLELPVAEELATRGVFVAPGAAWGRGDGVRVTLGDDAATDRLLDALRDVTS